jgi:hypothetical protein
MATSCHPTPRPCGTRWPTGTSACRLRPKPHHRRVAHDHRHGVSAHALALAHAQRHCVYPSRRSRAVLPDHRLASATSRSTAPATTATCTRAASLARCGCTAWQPTRSTPQQVREVTVSRCLLGRARWCCDATTARNGAPFHCHHRAACAACMQGASSGSSCWSLGAQRSP